MSKLKVALSDEEIDTYTSEGKGPFDVGGAAWCTYYVALCSTGRDSGTCGWIFEQCGVGGGGGGGGCGTCVCR
ncbi:MULTISPECIES: glycocin F family RiPP peptide [Shouchella]|uniref:Glycocin F family RiPP peptide n=2 Tax=Shouchella TaxID=2893057 RepID=A0ABY7W322_9BACI|nr:MULTISPECIES: glycocin F family RiPP peptide [Shouchella]MED4129602.1 glycocin F family RiPP peptide [Shouchella miscanthi]WDF03323.1 glycocin F family RiPP peptide [Shouchella hunanensis]GAF22877.1 hypothetical protein JCM19047_2656 [Bacillus sp. JCM 19047]